MRPASWLKLWAASAVMAYLFSLLDSSPYLRPRDALAGGCGAFLVLGIVGVYRSSGRGCLSVLAGVGGLILAPMLQTLLAATGLVDEWGASPIYVLSLIVALFLAGGNVTLSVLGLNLIGYWLLCAAITPLWPGLALMAPLGLLMLAPVLLEGFYRSRRGTEAAREDYRRVERMLLLALGLSMWLGTMATGIGNGMSGKDGWPTVIATELLIFCVGATMLRSFLNSR